MKTMKDMNVHMSNEKERNDLLNRSLALALQTMAINGLSLVFVTVAAFFTALAYIEPITHHRHPIIMLIYYNFLLGPKYAVTILNSNLGFFVHCYYSKMYRKVATEMYQSAKKKLFLICCCCTRILSKVPPESTNA